MPQRELEFILRFRNEAARALRSFQRQLRNLGPALRRLRQGFQQVVQAVDRFGGALRRAGEGIRTAGTNLSLLVSGPAIAGLFAITRASIQWEQALTGVAKTVDETAPVIARLGEEFVKLSDRIPISSNELARIGALAGQLGVSTGAIPKFAETIAKLSVSAEGLSTEAAALQLAQFRNVLGFAEGDVDRVGASLIDLGNNFAALEPTILEFVPRIAGAGKVVGLTAGEVLGFSTALAAVRVNSQAGGTAISRAFIRIAESVAEGGEKLQGFANIAGVSVDEFSRLFQVDAAEALTRFVEGLDAVRRSGGNLFQVFDDLGLSEIRLRDALLRLAGAGDLTRRAIERGNTAFEENIALNEEAEKFFRTLGNRLRTLGNQIANTAAIFGDALRPAIERVLEVGLRFSGFLRQVAERLEMTSDRTKILVAGTIAFAAALGPVLIVLGTVITLAGLAAQGFAGLSAALGGISFGAIAVAIGTVGATLLTVVAAVGAVTAAILTASGETVTFGRVVKEVVNGALRLFQLLVEAVKVIAGTIRDVLVDAFKNVGQVIGGVGSAVASVIRGEFGEAKEALVGIFDDASSEVVDRTPERFREFFDRVGEIFSAESDPLGEIVSSVGDRLGDVTGLGFLDGFKKQLAELPGIIDSAAMGDGEGRTPPPTPGEQEGFFAGIKQGFAEFRKEALDSTEQGKQAFRSFVDGVGDALDEFAETGRINFRQFASDALSAIRRIVLNRLFVQLIEGLGRLGGSGEGGLLSGLFGGGGAAATTATALAEGGVVGEDGRPVVVPKALFQGARRFQVGGRVDSVPALLTPGERVLTPEQNRAFERGMMGMRPIQINVTVQTPDVEGFRRSQNQLAAELGERIQRATARDT